MNALLRNCTAVLALCLLGVALYVCAQPGNPKVLFSEDFEEGLPGEWEGTTLITEALPEGSIGAACAKPGQNLRSNDAWVNGHFTVEDGLYFNYWARFDNPQWYQLFVFCKAKGQEAKDMSLYEAKPPVLRGRGNEWRLVSIPFTDFKATMGPNKGNSPKPGEVCWRYFWAFQKRNLGMAVDKVWVTKGKPVDGGPPTPAPVAEDARPKAATWPFEPQKDEFSPNALFDLRSLNENVAGESGFVRLSDDGNNFVLGNGKPARFWAVNTSAYRKHPRFPAPDLARHARFLAKRGVNMVRFHGNITPKEGQKLTDINAEEREQLWRLVAAMKKEGIYITFSPYWANSSRVKPAMGVMDAGDAHNHGLLFFDENLQAAYKSWMKQVLATKNPHTGIPLSQDPALAIIQLQNEDSLLFWTSQAIKGQAATALRKRFGEFLVDKYGALEKAKTAWGGDAHEDDNFAAGEVGLYIIWHLTQRVANAGKAQRFADQMEFFTQTMYDFNKQMADYLRNELGCKQLINAGNWRTADNVKMLDAERYSYSANEVIGVNRYYTGVHQGQHQGWAIINGDRFTDDSVLFRPRSLPVTLKQVEGHPIIIPESSWVPPLGYQSEGPFLVAAYQSLTGVDCYYWFATREEDWRQPSSANGYLPSVGKWVCHTPMLMGQWPAAALMYRMGYVKEGAPVVQEQRSLDDLWFRRMPIIAEDPGYDPNRDKGDLAQESNIKDGVNPLAYLVGPVRVKYDGDPSKSKVVDLGKCVDEKAKTIKSITGELTWDYGNGVCMLNAPKAQGVTGFVGRAGRFSLADVDIQSGNEYATILAVSMDGKPLSSSGKVLLQVGTTERPTGWKTRPVDLKVGEETRKGELITNFGTKPWQIVKGDVTLTIANLSLQTAHVLDANGMPAKEVPLQEADGRKRFRFPTEAMYVVLRS